MRMFEKATLESELTRDTKQWLTLLPAQRTLPT